MSTPTHADSRGARIVPLSEAVALAARRLCEARARQLCDLAACGAERARADGDATCALEFEVLALGLRELAGALAEDAEQCNGRARGE